MGNIEIFEVVKKLKGEQNMTRDDCKSSWQHYHSIRLGCIFKKTGWLCSPVLANANCLWGSFFPLFYQNLWLRQLRQRAQLGLNSIISLDLRRPTLGNLFTFIVKGAGMKCFCKTATIEREPSLSYWRKKGAISLWHLCLFRLHNLAIFAYCGKNAPGKMKHLENPRGHLAGMFCLALAFMARFCDYSATRFWNCKASYVEANCHVVMFQSVWSLLWKHHVQKQDHLGLGDNGWTPFDEKEIDQGSIRAILFEFTFFLSTFLPGDLYCFCINTFESTIPVLFLQN